MHSHEGRRTHGGQFLFDIWRPNNADNPVIIEDATFVSYRSHPGHALSDLYPSLFLFIPSTFLLAFNTMSLTGSYTARRFCRKYRGISSFTDLEIQQIKASHVR